jgi:hypothetical protein
MGGEDKGWAGRGGFADNPGVQSLTAEGHRAPISYLDSGWLYVLAGIALLAAVVILPAMDELAEVRLQRDRALAIEQHKSLRLKSYETYLGAVEREEPALVMALAASQLNQIPQGRTLIVDFPETRTLGTADASVFGALEPAPARLPERQKVDSILARWTSSDTLRPWLIVGGAVCVFIGMLPRAKA